MAQHTRACPDCRRDEAALRGLYREMNTLPTVEPPLYFRENVMAAIQRQQETKPLAWWQVPQQWNRLTRTAIGASLATGVAFAVLWSVFLPHTPQDQTQMGDVTHVASRPSTPALPTATPALHMSRVLTMSSDAGPAYDIQVQLTQADTGTVRFRIGDDTHDYRFNLQQNQWQTLRVPLSVAAGKPVISLLADWSTGGENHTRRVFLPVATSDKTLPAQQSFGLPDQTDAQAASEIAQRYGVAITLDDVPEGRIQINARQETALETLSRHFASEGMTVTSGPDGIVVARQTGSAVPATPAP